MANAIKLSLTGTVISTFKNDEGRLVINVGVTPKIADKIYDIIDKEELEFSENCVPVKYTEDDKPYIKMSSRYDFPCRHLPDDYEAEDIGEGTEGKFYFVLKENSYGKGRSKVKYVAAYITAVDITTFKERVLNNPFEDVEYNDCSDLDASN